MLAARRHMRAILGPSYISYSSGEGYLSTSLVINKPSGVLSGDLLVAAMVGSTFTGASGWTEKIDQGAAPALRIATLTAGGSEPSSYTFTAASGVNTVGQIICLRNAQFDVLGASVTTLSGDGNLVITAVTSAGGIILAFVATDSASSTIGHTTPSGMTLINTKTHSVVGYPVLSSFVQEVASGSTGTRTSTTSGTTTTNGGILMGVKK